LQNGGVLIPIVRAQRFPFACNVRIDGRDAAPHGRLWDALCAIRMNISAPFSAPPLVFDALTPAANQPVYSSSEAAPQTSEMYGVARPHWAWHRPGLGGLANGGTKFLLSGKTSGATSTLRLFFHISVLLKVI
jgi:hypothetical protein